MLTPIELKGITFKSGMGYSKKQVDDFLEDVCDNYEKLYKENVELKDKLATLSEGIQYYKDIEKTLQKALVLAEKTATETREAAELKGETIEREAKVKANLILSNARNELNRIHMQTRNLSQQYEYFKAQYRQILRTQLDVLDGDSFQIDFSNLDAFSELEDDSQIRKQYDETPTDKSWMGEESEEPKEETKAAESLEEERQENKNEEPKNEFYNPSFKMEEEQPVKTDFSKQEKKEEMFLESEWKAPKKPDILKEEEEDPLRLNDHHVKEIVESLSGILETIRSDERRSGKKGKDESKGKDETNLSDDFSQIAPEDRKIYAKLQEYSSRSSFSPFSVSLEQDAQRDEDLLEEIIATTNPSDTNNNSSNAKEEDEEDLFEFIEND